MKKAIKLIALATACVMTASFLAGCRNIGGTGGGSGETPVTPPSNETPVNPPVVTPPSNEEPVETHDPVFSGVESVTVTAGSYYDFLSGVSAVSSSGVDLTSRITVSGEVNTAVAGAYSLTYTVSDDGGNTASAVRNVYVSANPAIGEEKPIPVYETENPYNIARGCTATVTNSSSSNAENALDGDFTTRWESDHGKDDVKFTVDLGAVVPVEGVTLSWESAYATEYDLYYSVDGLTYELLAEGTNPELQSANVLVSTFSFAEGIEARFIRLSCSQRATIYGYSLWEFQVFGTTGTVVPTETYPILYESDGAVEDEQWILFDLGARTTFDKLNIEQVDWKSPAQYDILYSDENTEEGWAQASALGQKIGVQYGTGLLLVNGSNVPSSVTARYVKFDLKKRSFADFSYIWQRIDIKNGDTVLPANITASSSEEGFGAENLSNGTTPWKSEFGDDVQLLSFADFSDSNRKEGTLYAKVVDLGGIEAVGRVDLTWRNDDGGKGKYYDLQISSDGVNYETVFRQIHGATQKQSVFVYREARYLRILDYQNTSETAFMLEGIVVNSRYPASSGEGQIEYDVTLQFPERETVTYGNGSYVTGGTDFPTSRLIAYLDDSLRDKPVPSNDWWQGLLVQDKGYNMFMNPLTATFKSDGLWLTNPGAGYFSGAYPGNGSQTVDVDAQDIRIGYAGMSASAQVRVVNYSDYGITAVMTDNTKVDQLTVFLAEGTLYSYCLFAEPEKATVWADNLVAVYDLNGNSVLASQGAQFTGDSIVVCVRTHSGYAGGFQQYIDENGNTVTNAKEYEERYYVVNVPANTLFIRGESEISVVMTNGNYLSVGAMSGKTTVTAVQAEEGGAHGTFSLLEAATLHEHGYAFVVGTSALYSFDATTNEVETVFSLQTMLMRSGYSAEAYSAYLPHHTANSSNDLTSGYSYASVRGDCVSYAGNIFVTTDTFYGVVPTFTEPDDDGYSASVLYAQLQLVYTANGGDKEPDVGLISGDPYWQGKNLHPMSMAALAADQIGATDMRDQFLDKIEFILTDWFTYDPVSDASTGAYFYYDKEWGTLYYKNSEFGAGVNLADHYFTYGYYTLAAGVLCAYRPEFAEKFGNMIELLIRDYMNWSRDDDMFPYMRNFDMFSGHGWAGGYADNNGGNNQESAGEALNSWVGAYLYATAVGNEEIRLAAIYGYTTELSAIKHYWFNYYEDFSDCYPYGVAGQVYGASNFYGTFFNGEPLYMYGIHLIPGQEYLTSYALNAEERIKLEALIDNMREEQNLWTVEESHKSIYAWQHIFIPIVAIYDAEEAIAWYEDTLATQGNVGNNSEQFNVYYLIHGMNSVGVRSTDIWAENGVSATVYEKEGVYTAVCWNPTTEAVRYTFRDQNGVVGSALIPAGSLVRVDPTTVTENFDTFTDSTKVAVSDYHALENADETGEGLTFGQEGSATYLLACGTKESYCRILLKGSLEGAELLIDGTPYALEKIQDGYTTAPVVLTFRHTVQIRANGGTLSEISFREISLSKLDITGAQATASTENGANAAQNAVDGDATSRWESQQGNDEEWLEIELANSLTVYQMQIFWEAASAAEYRILFSADGEDWVVAAEMTSSVAYQNRTDTLSPNEIMAVRFIRIEGIKRSTTYGYSIYEIDLFGIQD